MENTYKIKVVAIAKDEAAYIPQWIHHHLFFGFDAVELWLNDISDNSLALLRQIQGELGEDVVSIVEADDVLERCVKAKRHFQYEAYNLAYQQESKRGVFTHLMFLDMDELWTPANFEDSIKDLLDRYPGSDAISFLWMVDVPDQRRKPFCRPFFLENRLQKNRHVKSLVKISSKVQKVGIHNHIIEDGVFHLCDGSAFDASEDVLRVNWAYISVSQVERRLRKPEEYFILHQIYRSKEEYLSSLLRGRRHTGDHENIFKTNRDGYLPFHAETHTEDFRISEEKLSRYDSGYQDFISRTKLAKLVRSAQDFVLDRCEAAFATLRADPTLLTKYARQLRGLSDVQAKANGNSIFGKIESIARATLADCVEIRGWVADVAHNRPIKFQFQSADGKILSLFSQRIARVDLYSKRRELGIDCGFRLEIAPEQISEIEAGTSGDVVDVIVKTYDGKERYVFPILKSSLKATSFQNMEKAKEHRGEVCSTAAEGGWLRFSGCVSSQDESLVEFYAAMDGLLFPLKKEKMEPTGAEPTTSRFVASLNLSHIPQSLQSKVPRIYAAVRGRSFPLSAADGYSYPADQVAAFYRVALPPSAFQRSLPEQEHACLIGLLPGKKTYLTYGAPDTASDAGRAGVSNVIFTDSNAAVTNRLTERMDVENRGTDHVFYPIHVNIGPTKELGYPADNSGWQSYPSYAVKPWELCAIKGISPDLVLIDGRFRVSCFLVSLMMARPGTILLFDDYSDRPQYHVVEKLLQPLRIHGRMAEFVVPERVDHGAALPILLRNCTNPF